VFGCGRLRVSAAPLSDSSEGVFIGRQRSTEGTTSQLGDVPVTVLIGKIASFSDFLVRPARSLSQNILVCFTNFSRFLAGLSTNFFHFFDEYPQKRREVAEAHLYDQVIGRFAACGPFQPPS
jgi:hypothetical protein